LGTQRALKRARVSLLTFFGKTKKVSCRRATPGNSHEGRGNQLHNIHAHFQEKMAQKAHE
jgi:hypothetical protein